MIWPFKKKIEKRNMAVADSWITKMGQPVYTNWTLKRAVKEGYKVNGWVYRSVYLIAKSVSQVQWSVKKDGEIQENHHLTRLFQNPNPNISRQDLMELVSAWLELAGNSYLYKVKAGGVTRELTPISPDRCHPVAPKTIDDWILGYSLDQNTRVHWQPEDIIHHKFFNPANPLLGIAPLQAAARATDVDNDIQDWNKAAMQNRAVVDGLMSFDRNFDSQDQVNAIRDKLNEGMAGKDNARRIKVVGSNAKYTRMGLNPVEMDFESSRKFNREEIFIIFGVPPVYAGVTEAATLNNYRTSELIFWFQTVIPLLEDIADTFNHSFSDELAPGETICPELNRIRALREAMLEWTKTAKELHEMGVPFDQLNRVFDFGFDEFDGWDQSFVQTGAVDNTETTKTDTGSSRSLHLIERRSYKDDQKKISDLAEGPVKDVFFNLLDKQRIAIFKDLTESNVKKVVDDSQSDWEAELKKIYIDVGAELGSGMVVEKRETEKAVAEAIEAFLEGEAIYLQEVYYIAETTIEKVLAQVSDGLENGLNVNDIQQAIIDSGVFDESRALMLARTITGSAANVGQITSAAMSGATHKTWRTASHEVRDSHQLMQGKTVRIDEDFVVGGYKASFPGDHRLPPKERANCRCTLSYFIED